MTVAILVLKAENLRSLYPSRAAQCIDKEILIGKNGNIDIDIEIDKRMFR